MSTKLNNNITNADDLPAQSHNTKEEKTNTGSIFTYLKNVPYVACSAFNYLGNGLSSVFTGLKNSLYIASGGLVGYAIYKVYQYICDVSDELDEIWSEADFSQISSLFSFEFSFTGIIDFFRNFSLKKIIGAVSDFVTVLYQTFFQPHKTREAKEALKEYLANLDPLEHLKHTDTDNKYSNSWNKDLNYNYVKRIVNYGRPYYDSLSQEAQKLYQEVLKSGGEYKSTNVFESVSSAEKSISSILNNALTKLKSATLTDYLVCLGMVGAGLCLFKAISNYYYSAQNAGKEQMETSINNATDKEDSKTTDVDILGGDDLHLYNNINQEV